MTAWMRGKTAREDARPPPSPNGRAVARRYDHSLRFVVGNLNRLRRVSGLLQKI